MNASSNKKRVRLSPDIRTRQILDAAFVEFSQHGFAGARMDDIAQRAGLSKGGVYAHFASKEEVFEALLNRAFAPLADDRLVVIDGNQSIEVFVDTFIERIYARLSDPGRMAMFRLVMSEASRTPGLMQRWHAQIIAPFHQAQARTVQEAVERGVLRRSPLTDNFWLAHAPVVYTSLIEMVYGNGVLDAGPGSMREAHRQMLLALLQAPEPMAG